MGHGDKIPQRKNGRDGDTDSKAGAASQIAGASETA